MTLGSDSFKTSVFIEEDDVVKKNKIITNKLINFGLLYMENVTGI